MALATVEIDGVTIPAALRQVKHCLKFKQDNMWYLTTRGGVVLSKFFREAALNAWWLEFQAWQGGRDGSLVEGKPKPKSRPNADSRSRRNAGSGYGGNPESDDPTMPWNETYDMPEFDAN
jgi:hypothetical protein